MLASYEWLNAVELQAVSEGKKLLRINCDETNVMRGMKTQKGLVVSCCHRTGPVIVPDSDPTRGSWTHLAFLCDDTAVQPALPQVIVGNEKMLRLQDVRAVERSLPDNVYLIRQSSSWMNESLFVRVLQWLSDAVKPYMTTHKPVLLLDCAPVHLTLSAWAAARKHGLQLVFIPRKLTWLLQPCDTHLFRRYKAWLNSHVRRAVMRSANSQPTQLQVLEAMIGSVRGVLQATPWARSFDANGYGCGQRLVSHRIRRYYNPEVHTFPIAAKWPTVDGLEAILPCRRSKVMCTAIAQSLQGLSVRVPPQPAAKAPPKPFRVFPVRKPKRVRCNGVVQTRSAPLSAVPERKRLPRGQPLFARAKRRASAADADLVTQVVDSWHTRLRPRRHGRHVASGSKCPDSGARSSTDDYSAQPCPSSRFPLAAPTAGRPRAAPLRKGK